MVKLGRLGKTGPYYRRHSDFPKRSRSGVTADQGWMFKYC